MALIINEYGEGVLNPVSTGTLDIDQTFTLVSEAKYLYIDNASPGEVEVLIKGVREAVSLQSYGDLDISEGQNLVISSSEICKIDVAENYKHWGENGDLITISTLSDDPELIICWLSE